MKMVREFQVTIKIHPGNEKGEKKGAQSFVIWGAPKIADKSSLLFHSVWNLPWRMELDIRKRVDFRSKRRARSPKLTSVGKLWAGISSPWKKHNPFIFLPLIMNMLLSSPLGTIEQNCKEECRRHFLWMRGTNSERKETQSWQIHVWLSSWSIMRCVIWGHSPPPGVEDPSPVKRGDSRSVAGGELKSGSAREKVGKKWKWSRAASLLPMPGTAALRYPLSTHLGLRIN